VTQEGPYRSDDDNGGPRSLLANNLRALGYGFAVAAMLLLLGWLALEALYWLEWLAR
jgi:hypothetical protein